VYDLRYVYTTYMYATRSVIGGQGSTRHIESHSQPLWNEAFEQRGHFARHSSLPSAVIQGTTV
jgi:hypothetical protein